MSCWQIFIEKRPAISIGLYECRVWSRLISKSLKCWHERLLQGIHSGCLLKAAWFQVMILQFMRKQQVATFGLEWVLFEGLLALFDTNSIIIQAFQCSLSTSRLIDEYPTGNSHRLHYSGQIGCCFKVVFRRTGFGRQILIWGHKETISDLGSF